MSFAVSPPHTHSFSFATFAIPERTPTIAKDYLEDSFLNFRYLMKLVD